MNSKRLFAIVGVLCTFFLVAFAGQSMAQKLVQLEFTFEDGAISSRIPVDETLHAQATLTFQGAGLVRGRWEAATPPSTSGDPVFRSLEMVNTMTGASRPLTLRSPALPANQVGHYLVRLHIDGYGVSKTLRYYVTGQ